jgi:galactokinase
MEFADLKKRFIELYGGSEEGLRIFASPGRVNLIGEHTDYNGGFVLPAALTMRTAVAVRQRTDMEVNLAATDLTCRVKASLDKLEDYKRLEWGNYQLGVAYELQKNGYQLLGCDMLYDDTVPHGGGLSSSAAIEVVTALAFVTISNEAKGIKEPIDMIKMSKIAQRAENNYVGVNCGIMDQFASAMGKANHAIFLNCKDLSYSLVPLDLKDCKIVISNTNKKRSLAHSKYNERRSECERGFEILNKYIPDATCLGDISLEQFEINKHLIEDEVVLKRVAHVISEDDRVLRSTEALKANNIKEFGKLMIQSHNSLRDLYEVTGVELDTLVAEALKIDGVIGSRMTGAGFGGCTVSIVKKSAVDEFIDRIGKNYYAQIGLKASFYVSEVGDGGREIK